MEEKKEEHTIRDYFDAKGEIKDPNEVDKPAQEKPSPSAAFSKKEEAKVETSLKKVTDLPEGFDLSKISDLNYLLDIFAEPYDEFKSLPYLLKMRNKLVKRGYPETPILNDYLFWTTISRRLQIEYQMIHVKNAKAGRIDAESISNLKILKAIGEQVTILQKSLNETLEKFEKISGVADLHEETMDEISNYVQEHIGEYSFKCDQCGNVIDAQGLPHWAIEKRTEPTGEKTYFVFSPEMWYAYKKGILPLHIMAFFLRTSIEGILITAERRGEKKSKIEEEAITQEESKSKQLLIEFEKTQR